MDKVVNLLLVLLLIVTSGCHEELPPTPVPDPVYKLGENYVMVKPQAGITDVSGVEWSNAPSELPVIFIREDKFLMPGDFYQFENHSYYDLGRIFGGLDAVTYYKEQGYGSYPNSRDFMFRYKWLGVTSFVDETDGHNKIIIEVEENTSNKPRWMFIHFYNGEWGFLGVEQVGATSNNL